MILIIFAMADYRRMFEDGYDLFITMVTYRRTPLLIENIDLLRRAFYLSKQKYAYTIKAIIVLPDHLHMIVRPEDVGTYPYIISHIKRSFVFGMDKDAKTQLKQHLSKAQEKRLNSGVWQRRYYEHTIKDEKDFLHHLEYIHNNAVKHGYVSNASRWVYSSSMFLNRICKP